jgi:hypothetical protein
MKEKEYHKMYSSFIHFSEMLKTAYPKLIWVDERKP